MSSLDLNVDVDADEFNVIRNSIIDWEDEDDTWNPDMDTQSVSSLEEDVTREVDSDEEDTVHDAPDNAQIKLWQTCQHSQK
ncbi:hypothetical protein ABVT39_015643 [Epinephelus coioides]